MISGEYTAKGTMKTKLNPRLIALALLAGVHPSAAPAAQFFRIVGPAATAIMTLNADGTLVWSNAQPGTNYTVQTCSSLIGGTNWVDYVQLPVTNSVNTNPIVSFHPPAGMVLIPAGIFTLGDTLDGESDAIPTNVTVSAFYMDVNLVSYSLWQGVYNYATSHGYSFDFPGSGKAANQPVQTLDWNDAEKWSNARSTQAGLTPVYYTDAGLTQVYTNGDTEAVYPNWSANGYRLPTEAEWEKAAQGGLSGQRFPWGNTISWSQANYFGYPFSVSSSGYSYDLSIWVEYDPAFSSSGNPYTSPVGSFAANGYGVQDMAGNVYEWCWDWYADPPYPAGSAYLGGTDPHGPTSNPYDAVVLRGGSWMDDAYGARSAHRFVVDPYFTYSNTGFRCVRAH